MMTELARYPSYSRCGPCDRPIIWAKRPSTDKWCPGRPHPPLEFSGARHIIVNDEVFKVATYTVHQCDPADIARHNEYLTKRREEQRVKRMTSPEYIAAREVLNQAIVLYNNEAIKFDCPKCLQRTGMMCINLVKKRSGVIVKTKTVHGERWRQAVLANPDLTDPRVSVKGGESND